MRGIADDPRVDRGRNACLDALEERLDRSGCILTHMASPSPPVVSISGDGRARVYRRSDAERFWCKVIPAGPADCWSWVGSRRKAGYGTFLVPRDGRRVRGVVAHRWAYESLVGPIPPGFHLDHLCRNTVCVNPAHLEAVSRAENQRRRLDPPPFRLIRAAVPMPAPTREPAGRIRRPVTAFRTHCKRGHEYAITGWARTGPNTRTCAACRAAEKRRRAS